MTSAERPMRLLMETVGVLLRRGYQRLRFFPHVGGAGYPRYLLTAEWPPTRADGTRNPPYQLTVWESLGGFEEHGFPWADRAVSTPEELADAFVRFYPALADAARGADAPYLAWYEDMLARTAPAGEVFCWWDDAWETPDGLYVTGVEPKPHVAFPPGYEDPLQAS